MANPNFSNLNSRPDPDRARVDQDPLTHIGPYNHPTAEGSSGGVVAVDASGGDGHRLPDGTALAVVNPGAINVPGPTRAGRWSDGVTRNPDPATRIPTQPTGEPPFDDNQRPRP